MSEQLKIPPGVARAITGEPGYGGDVVPISSTCLACNSVIPGEARVCPGCGTAVVAGTGARPDAVAGTANGSEPDGSRERRAEKLPPPHGESGEVPFMARDTAGRVELVWRALLGGGRRKMDDAVRAAAKALKERSIVQYRQLRHDSDLYEAIDDIIRSNLDGRRFEQRGRGYVRAITQELTREHWLACLDRFAWTDPMPHQDLVRCFAEEAERRYGLRLDDLGRRSPIREAIEAAMLAAETAGRLERQADRHYLCGSGTGLTAAHRAVLDSEDQWH